jgi:hypothetical protein
LTHIAGQNPFLGQAPHCGLAAAHVLALGSRIDSQAVGFARALRSIGTWRRSFLSPLEVVMVVMMVIMVRARGSSRFGVNLLQKLWDRGWSVVHRLILDDGPADSVQTGRWRRFRLHIEE